ncbi:MAG: four helix bundle protein [Saprospiraceae bacterium]
MQDFKKLIVWKEAHELTKQIYEISAKFPPEEKFGLTSQIRRSSASIPCNIAEGTGKDGNRDFAKYLQIAMGSAAETEYLIFLSFELEFNSLEEYQKLNQKIETVKKLLFGLLQKVRQNPNS